MTCEPHVLLLPGASGDCAFWGPLIRRVPSLWDTYAFSWPGLGNEPHDPSVVGIDDLVGLVAARLTGPSDLVAQSMGGIVALQVAARYPAMVRRLVLVATSAGFETPAHGTRDWRQEYRREYPNAAHWITDPMPATWDPVARIHAPTLLLWGDADPVSPPPVGAELARLLPNASLHVIPGGTHSLAHDMPDTVAALITRHLS